MYFLLILFVFNKFAGLSFAVPAFFFQCHRRLSSSLGNRHSLTLVTGVLGNLHTAEKLSKKIRCVQKCCYMWQERKEITHSIHMERKPSWVQNLTTNSLILFQTFSSVFFANNPSLNLSFSCSGAGKRPTFCGSSPLVVHRRHRDAFEFKLRNVIEGQNINGIPRLKGMQITVPIEYFLIIVTSNTSLEPQPSSWEQG